MSTPTIPAHEITRRTELLLATFTPAKRRHLATIAEELIAELKGDVATLASYAPDGIRDFVLVEEGVSGLLDAAGLLDGRETEGLVEGPATLATTGLVFVWLALTHEVQPPTWWLRETFERERQLKSR